MGYTHVRAMQGPFTSESGLQSLSAAFLLVLFQSLFSKTNLVHLPEVIILCFKEEKSVFRGVAGNIFS